MIEWQALPKWKVAPYFQPILSLQTNGIIGYEALGRDISDGEPRSLGPFFQNPEIPQNTQFAVDLKLREMAMTYLSKTGYDGLLFLNLKPAWIFRTYRETGELPTLRLLEQIGLPGSRLVIEITEEEFAGKLHELKSIIQLYRDKGCRIAVDDVGSGFSGLDRIAVIQPDIIKMDLKILKKSAVSDGYKALLRSFSIIAEQMGSSLLVEGVETQKDLQNAYMAGARYVQGFLFSEARPELQPADRYQAFLERETERFGRETYAKYDHLLDVEDRLEELAKNAVVRRNDPEDTDRFIGELLPYISENAIRIYICREDGKQVSSNFIRPEGEPWRKDDRFRGSNWIWRPYFVPNIVSMKKQKSGMISQSYADLDTSDLIQTFSCPLGEELYLFVDYLINR